MKLERFFLLALLSVAFMTCVSDRALAADKPNLIYIMVDDMGWADVGAYGSTAIATPNIDRMAAQGMRFTDAYSGCTVCAPARSSLMTGKHMGHTSVRGNSGGVSLLKSDVTLAEILKEAGYATGGFGKWGLGDLRTAGAAEKKGFDEFFGYYHQIHAHFYYPEYLIENGKHFPLAGNAGYSERHKKGKPFVAPDQEQGKELQFAAYEIFERMKAFIRANAAKDQPFFCYAPWTPPHSQYHLPQSDPDWQRYSDKPWPMNARIHAAFCSMMDRNLGETLELLKELQIESNTLVVFCSDNGASGRHEGSLDSCGPLSGFKRSMLEGGIRVPFIARWPGQIQPGSVSDLPIYFPDVLPTFAELAQVTDSVPQDVDGISIVPTLLGQGEQTQHDFLYWEYLRSWSEKEDNQPVAQAIRQGYWKALHDGKRRWRLYDLKQDIAEKNDLSESHATKLAELIALADAARVPMRPQREPKKATGRQYR